MKKNLMIFIAIFVVFPCCILVACNPYNEQQLANDIDVSVKNFIRTITNMDWPEESDIDRIDALEDNAAIFTEMDTEEIFSWRTQLKSKINILLSKRSDLLSVSNELVSNNVNLTEELYLSIKVYLDIIKDNSNYLTNYSGIIRNQINEINELIDANRNVNIINAYAIKIVETLCIRCAKIDTTILAMNSIIEIIEKNLIDNIYFDRRFVDEQEEMPQDNTSTEEQTDDSPNLQPDDTQIDIDKNSDIDITINEQPTENALKIEPDNIKQTANDAPIETSPTQEQEEKTTDQLSSFFYCKYFFRV